MVVRVVVVREGCAEGEVNVIGSMPTMRTMRTVRWTVRRRHLILLSRDDCYLIVKMGSQPGSLDTDFEPKVILPGRAVVWSLRNCRREMTRSCTWCQGDQHENDCCASVQGCSSCVYMVLSHSSNVL